MNEPLTTERERSLRRILGTSDPSQDSIPWAYARAALATLDAALEENKRLREVADEAMAYVAAHRAMVRGSLPLRSVLAKVRSFKWVQKMVNGALSDAIAAHGPINQVNLSSASKRVGGTVSAALRQLFTNTDFADLIIRLRQAEKKGGDAMDREDKLVRALGLAKHKAEQIRDGQCNPNARARAIIQVADAALSVDGGETNGSS